MTNKIPPSSLHSVFTEEFEERMSTSTGALTSLTALIGITNTNADKTNKLADKVWAIQKVLEDRHLANAS